MSLHQVTESIPVIDVSELHLIVLIPVMNTVMSDLLQVAKFLNETIKFEFWIQLVATKTDFAIGESDSHQFACDIVIMKSKFHSFCFESLIELLPCG